MDIDCHFEAQVMDPFDDVKGMALSLLDEVNAIKDRRPLRLPDYWYPYGTLSNVWAFDQALHDPHRGFFHSLRGAAVLDVGGCDGEMSFLVERLGASRTVLIDYSVTSASQLLGARILKEELGSNIEILEMDIDIQSPQIEEGYDLCLLLGVLYHLKNPFSVLEQLAYSCKSALLSTKIAEYSAPPRSTQRVKLNGTPLAYLLSPTECNNDHTNYWIFTEDCLMRLFARTGWDVVDYAILGGDMTESDPYTREGDRRAFCYLRSRTFDQRHAAKPRARPPIDSPYLRFDVETDSARDLAAFLDLHGAADDLPRENVTPEKPFGMSGGRIVALAEASQAVLERDAAIAELDAARASGNALTAERDTAIAARDAVAAERDALIAQREVLLSERSVILAHRESLMAETSARAAAYERLSSEVDGLTSQRDQIIADRSRIIAHAERLAAEAKTRSAEIDRLELELGRLTTDLQAILRSRSWRFTAPLRRLMSSARRQQG